MGLYKFYSSYNTVKLKDEMGGMSRMQKQEMLTQS